jgi:hypothetical protein
MKAMNMKRTATIVLVGAAFAGWLSAAMTPGGHSAVPDAVVASPIERQGAALAIEIARLHERLRPEAVIRQPGRNLFAFRTASARPPVTARPALVEAMPVMPIAQPALKLVGIAEDPSASGTVRTAIISGGSQLFLVKEGEPVSSTYRVERISADVVELADSRDGSTRRLALGK